MPPDYFKFLIGHTDKKYVMFKGLVEQFYYNCKVKNLSSNTLRGYGERLTNFYRFLKQRNVPFEKVERPTIQEYILSLKDRVSDYTINGRVRLLSLFLC
ncbi:MAG: site-specific integrase [Promethearchaeota archaeon]